jgi:hypothetical protein
MGLDACCRHSTGRNGISAFLNKAWLTQYTVNEMWEDRGKDGDMKSEQANA